MVRYAGVFRTDALVTFWQNLLRESIKSIWPLLLPLGKFPTDTYEFINRPCRNIVQERVTKLSQHQLELEEGMDCLPLMYWISKIHKIPVDNPLL